MSPWLGLALYLAAGTVVVAIAMIVSDGHEDDEGLFSLGMFVLWWPLVAAFGVVVGAFVALGWVTGRVRVVLEWIIEKGHRWISS